MSITPQELDKLVDDKIMAYGIEGSSLIVKEALRESIFIEHALGSADNFNHVKDLVEIPESMFIEYFLPTIIRPSLADKKTFLVKKVGGWQTEFKVVSDSDKTLLFVCPAFIKTLAIEDKIKWGDKEIDTNHVLVEVVNKSKLLTETGLNSNKANELVDGLTELIKFHENDGWTARWYQVFSRYSNIINEIVRVHSNEFIKSDGSNPVEINKPAMSLDDFE